MDTDYGNFLKEIDDLKFPLNIFFHDIEYFRMKFVFVLFCFMAYQPL